MGELLKIVFYGWKIDLETEKLIERMAAALRTFIKDKEAVIATSIIDVAVYGTAIHDEGWGFAFGKAIRQVEDNNEQLLAIPDPDLLSPNDTNKIYREAALETLQTVAKFLNEGTKENVPTNVVVRKEGVSIGKEEANIIIPEDTLKYIQDIRDLLGGGAIEITKGDLKVEIKEKKNEESR